MERKVIILIDGENISAKKADRIVMVSNSLGIDIVRRVYHRRKDPATREWAQKCESGDYKEICIPGRPARNKVDHVIQKEAREYMKKDDIDLVCIVSSDGDFCCLEADAANAGKELCFIVGKKLSKRFSRSGARWMRLG